MYADALAFLRCPACHAELSPIEAGATPAGRLLSGALRCGGCGASYPIRDGVADFLAAPRPATPAQLTNELAATAWAYERGWRPFALTLLSGESFGYGRELPLMTELAEPERGGLLLDIACSNGLYARALARGLRGAPGHVIGVDHAMPMLREAEARARAAGLRISYVRAEAQALPVAGAAASAATIGGSLNEIGDLDTCLAEVRRALAPGARFVAMTLTRASTAGGRAVQAILSPGGVTFWTPEELERRFERQGLRVERREQHGIVLFTLAR